MTNETFKPGDTIYLVDDKQADCEVANYIEWHREDYELNIGDAVIVDMTHMYGGNQWISFASSNYVHPSCKFSKNKP